MKVRTIIGLTIGGIATAVAISHISNISYDSGMEQGRKDMKHAAASYLLNHAAVHRNADRNEDTIRANELEARARTITDSDPGAFIRENSNQSAEAIEAYGQGL